MKRLDRGLDGLDHFFAQGQEGVLCEGGREGGGVRNQTTIPLRKVSKVCCVRKGRKEGREKGLKTKEGGREGGSGAPESWAGNPPS